MSNNSLLYDTLFNNNSNVNFSIGLPAPVTGSNSMSFGIGGQTSMSDTTNKTKTFQPSLYFDYLRDYPTLRTFVNILKAPILEAIDQINGQIKISITDKDKSEDFLNDAVIIANNFFEKCDFKSYLKNHLDDFILRGAYLSFINYREGSITDTIDPYNFTMVHNGKNYTWIIPKDNKETLQHTNRSLFTGGIQNLSNMYQDNELQNGFPSYKFITYSYSTETIYKETRSYLSKLDDDIAKNNIKTILGGNISIITAQKLTEHEKRRLDEILVLYSIDRPKSLFEPYLKSLFILSIKEMIFDLISLLQYLKPDYFTVTLRSQSTKIERISSIITDIKSALNRYNIDLIRTYEDPSGILAAVFDKLINRNEVLPVVDNFSDIQMLQIPDLDQRLSILYNDILDTKKRLADEIGIAQESISGNSNRWESISRNEKAALNEMAIKTTVEDFIKLTACSVVFNHMNEFFWISKSQHKEPTQLNFSNEDTSNLFKYKKEGDLIINDFVTNFSKNKDINSGSVGVMINPSVFSFNLNLSVIIDSYASKTKESIIVENINSTAVLLDNIKAFVQNHNDIIDKPKALEYIRNVLSITDYSALIVDEKKLKELMDMAGTMDPPPPPDDGSYGYDENASY